MAPGSLSRRTPLTQMILDASRFLAQSQSRLSLGPPDFERSRNPLERQRASSRQPTRGYLQRPLGSGNPYNASSSQASRFPFASRLSQAPAPLFYSATDEFREEDDGEEHEREVADYYALQRSRRDFAAAPSSDSSDKDDSSRKQATARFGSRAFGRRQERQFPRGQGIRSSWTGDEENEDDGDKRREEDPSSKLLHNFAGGSMLGKTKDRLVDVELASTIDEAEETAEQAQSDQDDNNPPSLQQLRRPPERQKLLYDMQYAQKSPVEPVSISQQRTGLSDSELTPANTTTDQPDLIQHDNFFGTLYKISLIAFLATFVLVILHTSAPAKSGALGDTVYSTLTSSYFLFAVDTVVAVLVALIWLAMLRHYVRPLVMLIIVSVPVILVSFTLYPFISSFQGTWHGSSIQDKAMRFGSLVPLTLAIFWLITVYKGRHSLGRAIELLEFSTRILESMSALIMVGFATLGAVVGWTWIWMLMFTRVFLGGHSPTSPLKVFVIDTSTWWLATFFIVIYLWTLAIISGLQRAVIGATVSQWYFHRYANPAPTSQRVVQASLRHASSTIFGTICFSTLLALAVRLPLLVLPGRLTQWMTLFCYSFVPTPIASLTNPLTLTYAAVHSQQLTISARSLSELSFITPTLPTTTLTPRAFAKNPMTGDNPSTPLIAYRLAKLILHSTRWIVSLAFGFGGWVSTARMLSVQGASGKGSLYAYVVGMIAGAIGYAVLGAMEGVLSGILDAVVVCWGSEMGVNGNGIARYCREAGALLSEEKEETGGSLQV